MIRQLAGLDRAAGEPVTRHQVDSASAARSKRSHLGGKAARAGGRKGNNLPHSETMEALTLSQQLHLAAAAGWEPELRSALCFGTWLGVSFRRWY